MSVANVISSEERDFTPICFPEVKLADEPQKAMPAPRKGNIMPVLYWYFPLIIFSGVCDLISPDLGASPRPSAATAYGSAHADDVEIVADEAGRACRRPH